MKVIKKNIYTMVRDDHIMMTMFGSFLSLSTESLNVAYFSVIILYEKLKSDTGVYVV